MKAAVEEAAAEASLSESMAVLSCAALSLLYVAALYSPTLILRLPPPISYKQFMIRRFICAAVSSVLSLLVSSLILLRTRNWKFSCLLAIYGIRSDHIWPAVVFPVSLTSLMYVGSVSRKLLLLVDSWEEHGNGGISIDNISNGFQKFVHWLSSVASNIAAWRNLVVAPLTEELVFRACMIPLLLCGGFKPQTVVFLCPLFFSLAHLNHLLEFYSQKNYSLLRTSIAVGTQLGYTMVFGSYASFLFVRTGHLISPLVAHIFCNFMGLPVVCSAKRGLVVSLLFMAGVAGFLWLLFPLTSPALFNDRTGRCRI